MNNFDYVLENIIDMDEFLLYVRNGGPGRPSIPGVNRTPAPGIPIADYNVIANVGFPAHAPIPRYDQRSHPAVPAVPSVPAVPAVPSAPNGRVIDAVAAVAGVPYVAGYPALLAVPAAPAGALAYLGLPSVKAVKGIAEVQAVPAVAQITLLNAVPPVQAVPAIKAVVFLGREIRPARRARVGRNARGAGPGLPALPALPALRALPPIQEQNSYEQRFQPTADVQQKTIVDNTSLTIKLNQILDVVVPVATKIPLLRTKNDERDNPQLHLTIHKVGGGDAYGYTHISIKNDAISHKIRLKYIILGNRVIRIDYSDTYIPGGAGASLFEPANTTPAFMAQCDQLKQTAQDLINKFLRTYRPGGPPGYNPPPFGANMYHINGRQRFPFLLQNINDVDRAGRRAYDRRDYNISRPNPAGIYNVSRGGNKDDKYKQKYLKYKAKYLALKNNLTN